MGDEFYTDGQADITQLKANSHFSQFFRTSPKTHKKENMRMKELNEGKNRRKGRRKKEVEGGIIKRGKESKEGSGSNSTCFH